MDNITDKQYLLQSMAGLVRDENARIVSLGLATPDEAKKLIESVQSALLSDHLDVGPDTIINALAFVHHNLSTVKLPGDFQKVACGMQDAFCIVVDIPVEKEVAKIETPQEGIIVIEPKDEKEDKKSKKKEKIEKVKASIIERLEKIAYGLGQKGGHEAAYAVERTIRELESMAGNPFDSGEFDQMEQKPRPQQLTQQQVAQMTQQMPQQEWQQRSQQAAQQVNQQARPQAAREKQHQQQAKQPVAPTQQPAQQPAAQQPAKPAAKPAQPQQQSNLKQLWQSLTPQQQAKYNQLRKQRPTVRPEQLIQMVKQQKQ